LKLADIPGVGNRIRERLLEHYGSEDQALLSLSQGNVADLLKIVSERQAIVVAQWVRGMKYGAEPGGFLATDEASRIYQRLLSSISSYAHTEYARMKVNTLFPSHSLDLLAENRRIAETAVGCAKKLRETEIEEHLSRIKPLRMRDSARIRDRAIATSDAQIFNDLKARSLNKCIDLHLAESPGELMDLMGSYSHVILVGDGECPDGAEPASSLDDWYLIPESVLIYYLDNLEVIRAALTAARLLFDAGINCGSINSPAMVMLEDAVHRLGQPVDAEFERLTRLQSSLGQSLNEAVSWSNAELKKRIAASSVTLEGEDLLQAVSRRDDLRDVFEIRLRGLFLEVLKDARARMASELEMTGAESIWLDEIFSSELRFPLELDRKAVHVLEQDVRCRIESRGLKSKRDLAKVLADKVELVQDLMAALMEFDFIYCLGRFSLAEGLSFPTIVSEPALGFSEGRNLFLDDPDPISYSLGSTGLVEHGEPVAVLSGVNSGGKTSLLDLVAQIAILAHMGLPVPALECRISLFQEFYYFSKGRGTLSAGAFETAMRKFAVVENEKRKLVLADELESITEPGASARIIACMLDELNRRGCVSIFVSHLAEDVLRFTETPVRVDGIEASGLDDHNNLLVNRNPRYNYLAKSTPELILERLARTASGSEREFYSRLLARFK
jgi:DNA mismatch repair protein MutS2